MGQRELARRIGISASYLNDIEKGKRSAPRGELISIISEVLDANFGRINDLAGISKNSLPPDIIDFIQLKPDVVPLLRMIKAYNLTNLEIRNIENKMTTANSKVLIVAAGMGSRLKTYTENIPKCMLNFGGKTLLQRQLEAYQECGVRDIAIIRGYCKD